ncbi:sigma factor-like helix-turn-helix DNA-binding protein [uncultured Clostridium sp.]|uniref:sigma factor-like helix-turn-helix DNA-binding protein n=1 Tax=uncultured Clostridium sp. TaxID=59620 RepID=UPI00259039FF|nr:sigma factor-like helix-turn-helix DNA-binding protein [uncultured Clostridium sp.]
MGIDYEKNHELEELLNFIRVANNTSAIRYACQIVSFILSKYQVELEPIAKHILDIFKNSSGIKKDYLAILFSEIQILDIQNEDKDEIINYSIELLEEFKISPNSKDMHHIDLYYRNNYITNIYIGIDSIHYNDDINKILINNILLDESFNEFKEICFSKNKIFLRDLSIIEIIDSYEKEVNVRNVGNIINDLVEGIDIKEVIEKYIDIKKYVKKDREKIQVSEKKTKQETKEISSDLIYLGLDWEEFLKKYKYIIDLDDKKVKEIFDYKHIPEEQYESIKKEFEKELNDILKKYLDTGNLTEREKEIFKLKCNIDLKREYTLEEIGEKFNLTKERIRQIISKCYRKIVNNIKRSKDSQIGREFYLILFKIFKESNNEYEKKLIITIKNKNLLVLYYSILQLNYNDDVKKKVKTLLKEYISNKNKYRENKFLEEKEANRQNKLIERILRDVIWFNKVKIINENIYRNIVQLRIIEEDENNSNKGSYFSYKMSKKIQYESCIEKDYLVLLENCNDVKYYSVQPFRINYVYEGTIHSYYPDIFFVLNDGRAVVVEVKSMFDMPLERNIEKYNALKNFCDKNGFGVLYTDSRNSFEKYASKSINNCFEKDIINELKKGPMDWRKCENIIFEHKADKQDLTFVIIKNNIKYTQNPFCIKL